MAGINLRFWGYTDTVGQAFGTAPEPATQVQPNRGCLLGSVPAFPAASPPQQDIVIYTKTARSGVV